MIKIKSVNKRERKQIDLFAKREWGNFGKERGYNYKEEKYLIAAYKNNKILGFAKFKIIGGVAYLSQLIVAKKARVEGLGSMLLKKFEAISKKKSCHVTYLETSEKHKEALNFYKKHGYKIVAELPNNKFNFTWYFLTKKLK